MRLKNDTGALSSDRLAIVSQRLERIADAAPGVCSTIASKSSNFLRKALARNLVQRSRKTSRSSSTAASSNGSRIVGPVQRVHVSITRAPAEILFVLYQSGFRRSNRQAFQGGSLVDFQERLQRHGDDQAHGCIRTEAPHAQRHRTGIARKAPLGDAGDRVAIWLFSSA
jgi:hypothetical protein